MANIVKITILICTRDQVVSLEELLQSLNRLNVPQDVSLQILVVDNGSTQNSSCPIGKLTERLSSRTIREPQQGLSKARNTGVANIQSDYVIFTDDDVIVSGGWLSRYTAAFRRYPDAAFFGGDVQPVFPNAENSWASALCKAAGSCFARFNVGPVDKRIDVTTNPKYYPFGANMAFRVDVLKQFRFDETLGRQPDGMVLSGEETKLIGEMVAAGHSGYLVAGNPVKHHIAPSRQTLEYVNRYYYGQGWLQASSVLKSGRRIVQADRVSAGAVAVLTRLARPLTRFLPSQILRVWVERQHGHFNGRAAAFENRPGLVDNRFDVFR